jgi:hypothetical protein
MEVVHIESGIQIPSPQARTARIQIPIDSAAIPTIGALLERRAFSDSIFLWPKSGKGSARIGIGESNEHIERSVLANLLQHYTGVHFGRRLGVRLWRHLAVEIDRRFVRRPNPGQKETKIEDTLGIDEEDDGGRPNSDLEYDPWMEDMLDYVHDRQCGHSPETARRVYGDTDHILQGMDGMRLKFRRCSKSLWRFYADATDQRRDGGKGEPIGNGSKKVETVKMASFDQCTLANGDRPVVKASEKIRRCMLQLHGEDAAFRSTDQARAVTAALEHTGPKQRLIVVLGTSVGGGLLFWLTALVTNKCNVVVTPLNALKNMGQRLKANKISHGLWSKNMGLPLPNLVIVSAEEASSSDFRD